MSRFVVQGVSGQPPPSGGFASGLRRALFRGAFFAAFVLASEVALAMFMVSFSGVLDFLQFVLAIVFMAVVLGLTAAPVGLVEAAFSSLPSSRVRDWVAGLVAFVVALGLVFVAASEVVFAFALIFKQLFSLSGALETTRTAMNAATASPGWMMFFTCLAAPFGPATLGRLRGLELPSVVVGSIIGTSLLVWPIFAFVFVLVGKDENEMAGPVILCAVLVVLELFLAAVVPLLLAGADALEARANDWLAARR
jgi:hypothetical protein